MVKMLAPIMVPTAMATASHSPIMFPRVGFISAF